MAILYPDKILSIRMNWRFKRIPDMLGDVAIHLVGVFYKNFDDIIIIFKQQFYRESV